MTDPTLHPPEFSKDGARAERDAERLTAWIAEKVMELEAAYGKHSTATWSEGELALDMVLLNEWDDAPLADDDPRWHDLRRAWKLADEWHISDAVKILEAL